MAARERLAAALEMAKETRRRIEERAVEGARATDRLVRENPYQSVGVAFGIGLAMGPLVRPDRRDRRHGLVLLGAGLLAGAAGCAVLLFTVPDRVISVPESGPTVEATVVDRPTSCGPGCHSVVVRYTVPTGDGEQAGTRRGVNGVLVLPARTLAQRGDRVLAVADPATPGRLRPIRPPQRVSPDSLFGAMAAALGATGITLLVLARRMSTPPYAS